MLTEYFFLLVDNLYHYHMMHNFLFQIQYYKLGDRILLCDMPGFEEDQNSIRLDHLVEILEGRIPNETDVTSRKY